MHRVKIIAEIGQNHNGDIDIAKRLIDVADVAGCDYVKFQKRTPEACVPDAQKHVERDTPWGRMKYIEYRQRLEFDAEQYRELFIYAAGRGIGAFASVWDTESAVFMTGLSRELVKVPSALIKDYALIRTCRERFEKFIVSTGMCAESDIRNTITVGHPDVLMHTCSAYPAKIEDLNLEHIRYMLDLYPCAIGYSGHEFGLVTTFAAVAMGATWIERHITLDRLMWGSDQLASVEPAGLIKLVKGIRDIEEAMGEHGPRQILESEKSKMASLRK